MSLLQLPTALVIKLGGRALDDMQALQPLLKTVINIQQSRPVVLVHGGGDQVSALLAQLGLSSEKVAGQRVTPAAHIPYIAAVLAGDVNSQLTALAQQLGLRSVGLPLFAGGSTYANVDASRGAVGIPQPGDKQLLVSLLEQGYLPVMSSLGLSRDGHRLNCNADLAAACIAELLDADLVLLTDVAGILDQQQHLISSINAAQAAHYIESSVVRDGMQVKLEAALAVAQKSRRSIAVASWQDPQALLDLAEGRAAGTRIEF